MCSILICSVVVREDKKLLTVLFPDGRDGRAFTLKVFSWHIEDRLLLFMYVESVYFRLFPYIYTWIKYQAETSEDLSEWKTALDHALAQAPSAALVMGHNGIFNNDTTDSIEAPFHQCLSTLIF